jgi:AraC-like DNA-binding protein
MSIAPPPAPAGRRPLGRDGAIRVYGYQCRAAQGDPPEPEQFGRPSISFVRSGVFGFRSEQRTQLMTPGFVLLGNPGRNFEVSHEHGGGDCCVIFAFEDAALEELAGAHPRRSAAGYFSRSVLPPVPRLEALRRLAEERVDASAGSLGLEELALELAAEALAQVGVRRPPKPPPDSRRARDRAFDALVLLERSSADEVHLTELADAVGLSPYHFLRLFKREVGVTPYRYLRQLRIRRAIDLLRDTERPVTEIAMDVGFGDLSNFINAFRREVGRSPRQFRRAGG